MARGKNNPVVDKLIDGWVSKKLTVFIIGTLFTISGVWTDNPIVTGAEWIDLAMVYVGTQGAIDGLAKLRGAK